MKNDKPSDTAMASAGTIGMVLTVKWQQAHGIHFDRELLAELAHIIDEATGVKELIEALDTLIFNIDPFESPDATEKERYDKIGSKYGGAIQNAWFRARKALARVKEGTT